MNRHPFKNSVVVGVAAIGVIAGIAVGFFTAHKMMGDRGGMTMGTGRSALLGGQVRWER